VAGTVTSARTPPLVLARNLYQGLPLPPTYIGGASVFRGLGVDADRCGFVWTPNPPLVLVRNIDRDDSDRIARRRRVSERCKSTSQRLTSE
jgi:hypothetical protein